MARSVDCWYKHRESIIQGYETMADTLMPLL